MNTNQKPQTMSDLARMGAKARWAGLTEEQRRAAMAKAHRARKRSAKLARLEKDKDSC